MRILLTGGTGCVGRRLTEKLLQDHHKVYSLVRTPPSASPVDGLILSNIKHPQLPARLDIAVHCAAITPTSGDVFSENLRLTKTVLELSHTRGVRHFIHLSSCSVFGDRYDGERNDDALVSPDSEYGVSKLHCERLVENFCKVASMPYTILRSGLIYGPHDRGALLKIIQSIDKGFFVCFGSGDNQKSLTSVELLAQIILYILEDRKFFNESFIVVDPRIYTVNEIITASAALLHRKPLVLRIPRRLSLIAAKLFPFFRPLLPSTMRVIDIKKFMANNPYRASKLQGRLPFPLPDYFRTTLAEEIQWYRSI